MLWSDRGIFGLLKPNIKGSISKSGVDDCFGSDAKEVIKEI